MLISQRFVVGKLKALGFQVPEQPSAVDDDIVNKILIYSGAHQRLLSLARCSKVTDAGIDKIPLCQSLLYLNFSYTSITDISALSTCVNLRGVNLAGTKLQSYDPIKWLNGLEVLNLNCSAIDTIGDSFAELRLLRSLDLGNTQLRCLRDLEFLSSGQLTRLEELYLDGTQAKGYVPVRRPPTPVRVHNQKVQLEPLPLPALSEEEEAEQIKGTFLKFFDKIADIECLRVINIGNSPAAKYAKHLQSRIRSDDTFVLSRPRSYYWFLSIINNDHEDVRLMILNGMDVNCRAGEAESDLFFLAWSERCGGKTPFFNCLSEDDALRPTAMHVAVFFNSVECLKHLVRVEAKQDYQVWMGKVDVESGSETDSSVGENPGGDAIENENLTSDESDEEQNHDGSLDSDDMMSLDSTRSDYEDQVEKKREQKRAQARERRSSARAERKSIIEESKQNIPAPTGRKRIASLKPTSSFTELTLKGLELAAVQENEVSKNMAMEKNLSCADNVKIFAKRVYNENVHRFTEKMTERRITGWKLVCKGLLTRIENILAGDAEEFDDDYLSVASVGTVAQVSVATEASKVKIVEAIKEEAAKKKLFSIADIRKMYASQRSLGIEEEEPEPVLAKNDPNVTDDDLFLCNLRRDSTGEIVGMRGQSVSEDMIRLQLQSAQSERASSVEGSLEAKLPIDIETQVTAFPELFASGSGCEEKDREEMDGEDKGCDDLSVITHDTSGLENNPNPLDALVADEFFPHIPALEQCMPWEPLLAKLTQPVVLKMYKQDIPSKEVDAVSEVVGEDAPKSRYLIKQPSFAALVKNKVDEPLKNGLNMEYFEISLLGKKSFWMESKRDMLKSRIKDDEKQYEDEEKYKLERWKTFVSESVAANGKVFGRDARIAKPMKLLHKNDGSQLTREERKQKLAQMLKENRERYVL